MPIMTIILETTLTMMLIQTVSLVMLNTSSPSLAMPTAARMDNPIEK